MTSIDEIVDSAVDSSGPPGALSSIIPISDETCSGLPVISLGGRPWLPPCSGRLAWALRGKRGIDIVGALLGLIVLSPVFVALAGLIVLTDGGPILFRQKRVGLNGIPFDVLKFRSMHVACCDPSGIEQVAVNDTRLTPVGAFMRRTSLDELAQLYNVLVGEMSLVGPRPHVPGMMACGMLYGDLVPHYGFRQAMRPGLTGWAQCNGLRGPTLNRQRAISRIRHDIAYVQNFSLWLDVRIMARTLFSGLARRDAI